MSYVWPRRLDNFIYIYLITKNLYETCLVKIFDKNNYNFDDDNNNGRTVTI